MKAIHWKPTLCLLAACILLPGCAGKYSDAKKLNTEFVAIMDRYMQDLDQADSAKEVADAMNRYADRLEVIWPKIQKLSDKYPELRNRETVPEELQESQKKAEAAVMKMAPTFLKLGSYLGDPEVMKAQERIGAIMTGKP